MAISARRELHTVALVTPDRPTRTVRRRGVEIAALVTLVAAACIRSGLVLGRHAYPAEDAAMLLRYGANLAAGHGFTYDVGHHPVDGATDFGLVVLLAGTMKVGLTAQNGMLVLDLLAQVSTVVIVYLTARRTVGASVPVAFVAAAAIVFGPAAYYIQVGFGTPVFACSIAATWSLIIRARTAPSRRLFLLIAFAGVVTGLIRPEGVLYFAVACAALLLFLTPSDRRELVRAIVLVYLPIGVAYFVWHWVHFGYPLPNPYYKKRGIDPGSVKDGLFLLRDWIAPFGALYVANLWRRPRLATFHALPVVGFGLAWALLSTEANYLDRFQYPLLVTVALSGPALWQALRESYPTLDRRVFWAVGATGVVVLATQWVQSSTVAARQATTHDGRYAVARNLATLPGRHSLAVTEAGLLPFYSGWTTLDLWGLNDEQIAHHGLTAADITAANPDLVMIHWNPTSTLPGWAAMEATALGWVHRHRYVLAADYEGSPDSRHLYYVKPGAGAARIVAAVRVAPYWLGNAIAPDVAPTPTLGMPGDQPAVPGAL